MASTGGDRAPLLEQFEDAAEVLVSYQLDLLAQLEHQLRAVGHMMRHIERLRAAGRRAGPELSPGERVAATTALSSELSTLEMQTAVQRQSCVEMQATVADMSSLLERARGSASPAADETSAG